MNPLLLEIIKPLENDLEYEIVIDEGSIDFIKKGHLLSMPSMKNNRKRSSSPKRNL